MEYENFTVDIEDGGVALVTWDMPGRSMNVLSESSIGELDALVDRMCADDEITGVIFTSGKATFCAGGDLSMLTGLMDDYADAVKAGEAGAAAVLFERCSAYSRTLRRLETCGKPLVAAINGTALGGGLELALACHHRIVTNDPATALGLPESRVGLLPGGGGTQRLPRLIGAAEALPLMLRGSSVDPEQALALGIVHETVSGDVIIDAARRWFTGSPDTDQPWDTEKFRLPGGLPYSPAGMNAWAAANALYRRETYDNYPAQRAIMSCVYEGIQLPMDSALRVEARYFTWLLRQPETHAMTRSLFFSTKALGKGARRPSAEPPRPVRKIGVLGAGTMGAGIAFVSAHAGINVVLLDRDLAAAEKGRAAALATAVSAKDNRAEAGMLADRILATADFGELEGCELVIEAVFEDRDVKADVTRKAEAHLADSAVMASNTSALPISGLAAASTRPANFLGLHFFSPVERMKLVEVIAGERTGNAALARGLDYVAAIGKTPIVVNDGPGFYSSRVVFTYIDEGLNMLCEGIPAAMIDNVGRIAGLPVGPLALTDEVSLALVHRIRLNPESRQGSAEPETPGDRVLDRMVREHGRLGRRNGRGFYDYPSEGRKRLWPGLADLFPTVADPEAIDTAVLGQRLLFRQALEAVRCFEEGIVTDVREADVGAILGWGFAPFTGGPLSYIDTMGTKKFLALCEGLAADHGPRFAPCDLLRDLAAGGETFYARFAPEPGGRQAA